MCVCESRRCDGKGTSLSAELTELGLLVALTIVLAGGTALAGGGEKAAEPVVATPAKPVISESPPAAPTGRAGTSAAGANGVALTNGRPASRVTLRPDL